MIVLMAIGSAYFLFAGFTLLFNPTASEETTVIDRNSSELPR